MIQLVFILVKGKNTRTKSQKCVYNCLLSRNGTVQSITLFSNNLINYNMMPRFVTQVLNGTPLCGSTVVKYTNTIVCIEIMFKELLPTYNVMYCRVDAINVNRKRDL